MLGVAVIVAVLARVNRVAPGDTTAVAKLEKSAGHLARMLPVSGREFRWFAGLSVTAGVCEEALYRGFLIWYLGAYAALFVSAPHVFAVAAAGSSLVFGLGHSYQGVRNALVTALTGGFLAAVVWISGSLYAAMLIHALMDLQAGHTSYAAHAAARARVAAEPEV
jgi:membrane protease YdiL (CAAX protease family)